MKQTKIDHVAIAVESIEEALPYYRDVLGLEFRGEETVEEQQVRVAFLGIGESAIELVEPLDETGPVARFIGKHGEGIHHIALDVESIEAVLEAHRLANLKLIDTVPRKGARGKKIAFIHPKSAHGVLIELCERP
jgi:methylmalonyl-CoA epimerase